MTIINIPLPKKWLTLLDNDLIESQFDLSPLDDAFLYRILANKSKHVHLLLLADTMRSILKKIQFRIIIINNQNLDKNVDSLLQMNLAIINWP